MNVGWFHNRVSVPCDPIVGRGCLWVLVQGGRAFRHVAVSLRGLGKSLVLPLACSVGSLCYVSRCGLCSY